MDPVTLAGAVISVLLPYASKGAEKFAEEIGKSAFDKVKNMISSLKAKWQGDEEALDTLKHFEEKPERYQPVLEDILKEKLAKDKELAHELMRALEGLGPEIQIIQKMEKAEQVTGVEAEEMAKGTVQVTQEFGSAKGIIGAKIGHIG